MDIRSSRLFSGGSYEDAFQHELIGSLMPRSLALGARYPFAESAWVFARSESVFQALVFACSVWGVLQNPGSRISCASYRRSLKQTHPIVYTF